MRRTASSDKNNTASSPSDMADSTATKGGYRTVPTAEGSSTSTLPRPPAPAYGTANKPRSPASILCIALSLISLSLLLAATFVSDMPLADRLRAGLFSSAASGPAPTSALGADAVGKLNGFGLGLFARLAGEGKRDVVVSPASVASALTMVAAGATEGSAAEKELEALLGEGFGSPASTSDRTVELNVANSAWVSGGVKDAYKAEVKKTLGAQVEPLPSSVDPVNDWVKKQTRGNIDKILDVMPPNVVALLINAVFFKASWTTEFDPAKTQEQPFYSDGGKDTANEVSKVRMMRLTKQSFPYAEVNVEGKTGETLQVVEMPYGTKNEYSATIVVPTGKTTIAEVAGMFKDGNSRLWDEWVSKMRSQKLDLMAMPRFKIEYGVKSLKGELQDLGIKSAFVSDKNNSQFLKMSDDEGTYLDDVLHKATIECTEKGTVASAATAAIVMTRSMPRESPKVVLDRPFLFAIRNRVSGALLFLSRVDNPVSPP